LKEIRIRVCHTTNARVLERIATVIILGILANHPWFTLGRLGHIEYLGHRKRFGCVVELGANSCNAIEISCVSYSFDYSGTENCSLLRSRLL
jgi:hypothetical protein